MQGGIKFHFLNKVHHPFHLIGSVSSIFLSYGFKQISPTQSCHYTSPSPYNKAWESNEFSIKIKHLKHEQKINFQKANCNYLDESVRCFFSEYKIMRASSWGNYWGNNDLVTVILRALTKSTVPGAEYVMLWNSRGVEERLFPSFYSEKLHFCMCRNNPKIIEAPLSFNIIWVYSC